MNVEFTMIKPILGALGKPRLPTFWPSVAIAFGTMMVLASSYMPDFWPNFWFHYIGLSCQFCTGGSCALWLIRHRRKWREAQPAMEDLKYWDKHTDELAKKVQSMIAANAYPEEVIATVEQLHTAWARYTKAAEAVQKKLK